jgi:cyclophilin family peptidyl-prolyl cis-trans isomerase
VPVSRVEKLEKRALLSAPAHVTSIVTDNRGEVQITFDKALDPTTVNTRTVQVHTEGADHLFGTADDVRIIGRVKLHVGNRRIWWRPADLVPFAPGSTFSVKVSGKSVLDVDGNRIDGEFNGPGIASGNGIGGGDSLFLSKRDKNTSELTARFSTVEGNIDVALDLVNTPKTAANFLDYANNGLYDTTFFHRSVPGFIVQGGGFNVDLVQNTVGTIPTNPPVQNEFKTSNTRGTIAMAKLGGDPNSSTDQWFFNLADNSSNLDAQNGGFTVFGHIKNSSGLTAMDNVGALPTKDLTSKAGSDTSSPFNAMNETPVLSSAVTADNLNPLTDLTIVRRVAILNKYVAFPFLT